MSNENNENPENNGDALPTYSVDPDSEIFQAVPDLNSSAVRTSDLIIVSFYLPGRAEPIIVSGAKTITIGRRDPKRRINPTIDLTEDHGAKLGVSRLHAEMNFVNGKYYVKDTGSSNGTWVNDTKLQAYQPHPVLTGDQVRIGQLAIVVHLSLPQRASNDAISTVIDSALDIESRPFEVLDKTGGMLIEEGVIVLSKLRNLSTYLEQLSRIHDVIREARQQEASPFAVKTIRVQASANALVVDVSDGKDIMDFMANKFDDFVNVVEGKSEAGSKKQTDSLERYSDPLEQIADYALQELVFKFMTDNDRDTRVRKLAGYFDTIKSLDLSVRRMKH